MDKKDKSIGAEKEKKPKEDEIKPWAVDLIAAIFILRGLTNLLYPFLFGSPFDEYYEFLGNVYGLVLNISSVIVGFGIYKCTRWGYLSGLVVACFSLITEADPNYVERFSGRILSIICFLGLMKAKKFFPQEKFLDKVVAGIFAVIILGSAVYGLMQPSEREMYKHYENLALETKDWKVCNNIRSLYYRGECITTFMWNLKINDPLLCENIEDALAKDNCFKDLARMTGNNTYCERIKDSWSREGCIKVT